MNLKDKAENIMNLLIKNKQLTKLEKDVYEISQAYLQVVEALNEAAEDIENLLLDCDYDTSPVKYFELARN
ncbi:MAG TPA: hypothetical protein ENJ28_05030 [Gammaproteobacteria bacterium]|nr:hypothetical protein [Gammaproteobacteria bacterium]